VLYYAQLPTRKEWRVGYVARVDDHNVYVRRHPGGGALISVAPEYLCLYPKSSHLEGIELLDLDDSRTQPSGQNFHDENDWVRPGSEQVRYVAVLLAPATRSGSTPIRHRECYTRSTLSYNLLSEYNLL
jgi:hypothetical protein